MRMIKINPSQVDTAVVIDIDMSDLENLRQVVGGFVELVRPHWFPVSTIMAVDEEASIKPKRERNVIASNIYGGNIFGVAVIVQELWNGETESMDICNMHDSDICHWLWLLKGIRERAWL